MPSHLHPRSRMTTSLFGTTLLVSFLVVGMPHILPCPAPRTHFTDYEITEDGKQRRRRRPLAKHSDRIENDVAAQEQASINEPPMRAGEDETLRRKAHECPVPKPGGRLGEIFGFPRKDEKLPARSAVQIEPRA
ncbi:MAG: hypothetical protein Q9209_000835 [Squamulea sp. 1 TL-2023]